MLRGKKKQYFYVFLLLSYTLLGRQNEVKEVARDVEVGVGGPDSPLKRCVNFSKFLKFSVLPFLPLVFVKT